MKYLFYFSVLSLLLSSCINDKFSVGDNLVTVNGRTMFLDSCSVEIETQIGDSSVTSGLSRLFEGRYTSADFGTITTHAYFDFSAPGYSKDEFGANTNIAVKFDSITLTLKYDKFNYGDTTKAQTLHIYRLKETIELDDKSQLYSTSFLQTESEPWVSHRFNRPNQFYENDSIFEIRLPDEFGQELFRMMHAQSDTLDTYDNFRRFFKGIKLSPEEDENAAINSFVLDESYPIIKIHYRTIGASSTEKEMTLKVTTDNAFSQIETDRSNTLLQDLNAKNYSIPTSSTENRAYIQGLTGVYAKLTFPTLNEILKYGEYIVISEAYLYIQPVSGTYNEFVPLPGNLLLNYLDESGKAQDIYIDAETTAVQSGVLVEDKIYNKDTYYVFDISSYIKQELGLTQLNKTHLQLQLADEDQKNSLKSLVFGDSRHSNENNRVKLIISLVVYDNN